MINEDLMNIKVKCVHNNEIRISIKRNDWYWSDGAHLELEGCESCIKEIENEVP